MGIGQKLSKGTILCAHSTQLDVRHVNISFQQCIIKQILAEVVS